MLATNKKKTGVMLFLAAFVTFGIAGYNPPGRSTNGEFKNLKVLPRDISKDSLDGIMDSFKTALGVKCTFCHVHKGDDFKQGWDFPSDEKSEKKIARHMMRMTAGINANYFNFDNSDMPDTIRIVTCNTCHRGVSHPDAQGILDQKNGVPPREH